MWGDLDHHHDRVQNQSNLAERHPEGRLVAAEADQALAPQLLFLYLYHVRLHKTLQNIFKNNLYLRIFKVESQSE